MAEAKDRPPQVISNSKKLTVPLFAKRYEVYSSNAESTTAAEDWLLPKTQVIINKENTTSEVINTDIRKQLSTWLKSGNLAKKIDAFIQDANSLDARQLRRLLNQLVSVDGVQIKHGDILQEMIQNSYESMELRRGRVIKYLEESINPYLSHEHGINFQIIYPTENVQFPMAYIMGSRGL